MKIYINSEGDLSGAFPYNYYSSSCILYNNYSLVGSYTLIFFYNIYSTLSSNNLSPDILFFYSCVIFIYLLYVIHKLGDINCITVSNIITNSRAQIDILSQLTISKAIRK